MMLRHEPLAHLPALLALALAAMSLPARAEAQLTSLCSGRSLPGPQAPRRECDQACHVGCSREKKTGSSRL